MRVDICPFISGICGKEFHNIKSIALFLCFDFKKTLVFACTGPFPRDARIILRRSHAW